jgi:rhamnogalacturonan endolyase
LVILAITLVGRAQTAPVTLTETATLYTLDNGIVTARVAKASGDLVSLRYKNTEMLATFLTPDGQPDLEKDPPGENLNGLNRGMTDHQYGFWSHDAMGPKNTVPAITRITLDPKSNGGARAEVSVKGVSGGRKMGTGPGSNAQGQFIADVEIRYALGRGDSGVYTYSIFEHKPEYGTTTLGEARVCFKLNDFFDWMLVDDTPNRNKLYPKTLRENKYNYTTLQSENPAFGWASTAKKVGFFIVNPSLEYMSGGPTKVEFLCHRDTNAVAAPCVLNYWRSSHYGGANVTVAEGERWMKVIGPIFVYVNSGADPQALRRDALAQQEREATKWPYAWVSGVDFPLRNERSTVSGQLALQDPTRPGATTPRLHVGLTHAAYGVPAASAPGAGGAARQIDWQTDATFYQFWTRGSDDGRFTVPHVRPGSYTLHAFADGVLGEFIRTEIKVEAGKPLELGKLAWTPVRRGRQLWEIGIPNRTAREFFKGDDYFHDGMPVQYAKLFPKGTNFVIGQSDFRRDWYYQHVPHADADGIATADAAAVARANAPRPTAPPTGTPAAPAASATSGAPAGQGARGARGGGLFGPAINGAAAPRTITFDVSTAPKGGKATLRLAICGTGARSLEVSVNHQPVGAIQQMTPDSTFGMGNGIQGIWNEREVSFDARLLKSGTNVLTLTIPAGPVTAGLMYDYLRLELDESAQ